MKTNRADHHEHLDIYVVVFIKELMFHVMEGRVKRQIKETTIYLPWAYLAEGSQQK